MYSQSGSWIAVAGVVVLVLSYFGINIEQEVVSAAFISVVKAIADIAVIVGIIKQAIAHKKLAQVTGVYPK